MRADGRKVDELRPLTIESNYLDHAEGSAMIKCGDTWVLCAASVEEGTPGFVEDGKGWLTGEYAMLPRATHTRSRRGQNGRAKEIQRLIGRSLRASIDMAALGPRTITIDCDVIQADGGTRTAAITGGYVALAIAVRKIAGIDHAKVLTSPIAAISVGIVDGVALLDLPYEEDSRAEVDMNIVMSGTEKLIELQGTAERAPFSRPELDKLLALASKGMGELVVAQNKAIEQALS